MASHETESSDRKRKGHAPTEVGMRILKAQKIARLLSPFRSLEDSRILEIGCGTGEIAGWFAREIQGSEVVATDIEDIRTSTDGYQFRLSTDAQLEFEDSSFDVVISNHVIEHIGEEVSQTTHLAEIARVLRPSGFAYLATPNRWWLVEGHYRLPLLSWFPPKIASSYVRLAHRGSWYDVVPLSAGRLKRCSPESALSPTLSQSRLYASPATSSQLGSCTGSSRPLLRTCSGSWCRLFPR